MAAKTYSITPEIADYIQAISLREPTILKELRELTLSMEYGLMQVSPELGQFMQLLIRLTGSKKILELGVFTGYSTLSMAMALPEDGHITACDISEEWTSIGRSYWQKAGQAHKIDLRLAPAVDTLRQLQQSGQNATFDFIFLDADKGNYPIYYEYCVALLRPNGLMLIDNTLWEFKVTDPNIVDEETNAIQKLNLRLKEDDRVDISLVLFGDGLTIVRKR